MVRQLFTLLEITKNVSVEFFSFGINFCPFITDLLVTLFDPKLQVFKNPLKT